MVRGPPASRTSRQPPSRCFYGHGQLPPPPSASTVGPLPSLSSLATMSCQQQSARRRPTIALVAVCSRPLRAAADARAGRLYPAPAAAAARRPRCPAPLQPPRGGLPRRPLPSRAIPARASRRRDAAEGEGPRQGAPARRPRQGQAGQPAERRLEGAGQQDPRLARRRVRGGDGAGGAVGGGGRAAAGLPHVQEALRGRVGHQPRAALALRLVGQRHPLRVRPRSPSPVPALPANLANWLPMASGG